MSNNFLLKTVHLFGGNIQGKLISIFLDETQTILALGVILYAAYPDLSGLNYSSSVVWSVLATYIIYTFFLLQNPLKQLQALGWLSNDLLIRDS